MFLSVIKIYPRPGCESIILDVLESLKGPTVTTTGCLGCSVAVETGEGGAVCYSEQWRSRDELARHLRSPLYGRLLEAMECSCRPPEIAFYEVTGLTGLETVEKARTAH